MILDASGRTVMSAAVTLDVTNLADVAALCFLLNAHLHGPDCGVAYSRVVSGHPITGVYIAFRATRRGVQQRAA